MGKLEIRKLLENLPSVESLSLKIIVIVAFNWNRTLYENTQFNSQAQLDLIFNFD